MRGRGQCGSKACDDDAYLAEMKKKTDAMKKDQDARMKKEIKGIKVEVDKSKRLEVVNPMHRDTTLEELNNLGGRKTRKNKRRRRKTLKKRR
jgi:hypothetical protein